MYAYLDNASTTPLDPDVIAEINTFMRTYYGNPSSTHSKGREARVELEKARKKIASIVGAQEKEIIFTSGGTEGNNFILKSLALEGKIEQIISSPLEHHSVLDTLDWVEKNTKVNVVFLAVDSVGRVDLTQLDDLLQSGKRTLVSLMHGNNEIGNLQDLEKIGTICQRHDAFFHTDMVQTLGHYPLHLNKLPIDFATASAHKIHGPKGVGFVYMKSKSLKPTSYLQGGAQERGIRGGTENISGIIGMSKAYEIANESLEDQKKHILTLKERMMNKLKTNIEQVRFNGESGNLNNSLHSILNVQLPGPKDNTLLFNLDLRGVAVSEGSACSSGAPEGSHVLRAMGQPEEEFNNLRISFSKLNNTEEIDFASEAISDVYKDLLK